MARIGYRFIYAFLEGTVYVTSIWLCISRFFGYPVQKAENRKRFFLFLVSGYAFFYTILNTLVSGFSFEKEKTVNGLLIVFLQVYWTIRISRRKEEAFFVTLTAVELLTVFLEVIFSIENILINLWNAGEWLQAVLNIPALLLLLLLVFLLASLSDRRRKSAMSFPLVISTFLMLVLGDNLLMLFEPAGFLESSQPVVTMRFLYGGRKSGLYYSVLILLMTVLILMISFLFIIKESEAVYYRDKNLLSEYYLKAWKEHYEKIITSSREMKKLRHDMKNHIYVLKELLYRKDYKELGAYLDDLVQHVEHTDNDIHTGNEIADAILSEKKQKAQQQGIRFLVSGGFYAANMSALDICTILANMADNAIEAVEKLDDNMRYIEICFGRNEHFFWMREQNPVSQPVEIQDNRIRTTKRDKKNHGFGIENIMDTVERYEGECILTAGKKDDMDVFQLEMIIPLEGD